MTKMKNARERFVKIDCFLFHIPSLQPRARSGLLDPEGDARDGAVESGNCLLCRCGCGESAGSGDGHTEEFDPLAAGEFTDMGERRKVDMLAPGECGDTRDGPLAAPNTDGDRRGVVTPPLRPGDPDWMS
jgi:hypothetical protein